MCSAGIYLVGTLMIYYCGRGDYGCCQITLETLDDGLVVVTKVPSDERDSQKE